MIFSPILLRTIFKKFIVSLIYWGEASYDQSITTAGFTETQKHQVYTCNIQQHQHNHAHWLAEFFNLSFDVCTDYVWDMPFVLVISYISVTQSFISLRILRMSNFMLQVAVSSLHIYFFHKIPMVRLCEDCLVLFSINFINFFLKSKFKHA